MSQPLLIVDRLAVAYGDRLVLEDVSLTVEPGEIVVVLGASGCGKSTLLRCIVGLLEPVRGRVLVAGEDVHRTTGAARERLLRRLGMAFQSSALLNSLTVAENVALPIREHLGLDDRTARMLACLHLSRVGLAHAADLLPSELSGGMRKRAGLARALALDPVLLLFDEPSAGLDPITARELDDLVLRLRERGDLGIVVVTHELGSIEAIADRAVMLSKGRVLAAGPLADVRALPDPEVRAFFTRQARERADDADLLVRLGTSR